jgi:hypothetical protein
MNVMCAIALMAGTITQLRVVSLLWLILVAPIVAAAAAAVVVVVELMGLR